MKLASFLVVLSLLIVPTQVRADETTDLLREAIQLLEAGETAEAREVIAIALDQIDHQMLDTTAAVFPLKSGAFTRGDVMTQKTMGVDLTRCTYTDANGNEIDVQLMGGAGGVLNNLADLGVNFGGARKVRKHGRSGSLMDENGNVTMTLKLKCGKNLVFETNDLDADAVDGFVDGFPVVEIDDSAS